MSYIVDEAYLKSQTGITQNVSASDLLPYRQTTQDNILVSILGEALFNDLIARIAQEQVIAAASNSNPVVVTTNSDHGFITGDEVYHFPGGGMPELSGVFTITILSDTSYSLDGVDGTAWGVFTSGTAKCWPMDAAYFELWERFKPVAAWYTFHRAIPGNWIKMVNKGLVQKMGETSKSVSRADMQWYAGTVESDANTYRLNFIKWLSDNKSDYPLYDEDCENISKRQSLRGNVFWV